MSRRSQIQTAVKSQKRMIVYSYVVYIAISITAIVCLNHYGLKMINGLRAFISGESSYMKAQHEASRHLTNYIFTSKPAHYEIFLEKLEVPINDSLARLSMEKHEDKEATTKFLLKGKNLLEDADNIIWVYNNFKYLERFNNAVIIWKQADVLVIELEALGKRIDSAIKTNPDMAFEERKLYASKVDHLSRLLTIKGNNFDTVLIENVTFVNRTVLLSTMILAIIIAGCLLALSMKYINRLASLQKNTLTQNEALIKANAEMDLFTHSVSHDLRTPISSLQGLLQLSEIEDCVEQRKEYFVRMKEILSRQDDFILKIINFSKNKRTELGPSDIFLPTFLRAIVDDLKSSVDNTCEVVYDIEPKTIHIDAFRLDIICKNLISNALKYADRKKASAQIYISAKCLDDRLKITVKDNGIGIEDINSEKIFEMFYVTSHKNKGSGIGLYLVKEMTQKMGGKVKLTSVRGQGSEFEINLPLKG